MGERVAFLCLGTMGRPMAGHLARVGHSLTVYNRTGSKARDFVAEHGGRQARTPEEAARGARYVFACTGNDDDLREICLGPAGAFAALQEGAIFVDHTTASAELARELAAAATGRGAHFLDAPISGGEEGARSGTLTVMAGGDPDAFERARGVFGVYARHAAWLGPSGAGQLAKMVNQICIAGIVQSLSEGIAFAERAGIDPRRVVDVIRQGAAQSWQMDHRAETMVAGHFEFGFAVDWMRKDLGIARAEAARNGARLPVATLVEGFYREIQRSGGGRLDTSSLITLLRES